MKESIISLNDIYNSCHKSIKSKLKTLEFLPGELIVKQDEPHNFACVLIEGIAKISVMTEEGKSIVVSIIRDWELFGETELFNESTKEFDVEAITCCKVVMIDKEVLFEWLEADFNLVQYMLSQLSRKLNESAKTVVANTLYTLEYRFSILLYSYCNKKNGKLEMDKELVAQFLGTTVRSVNRLIENFEKKKFNKI